VISPIELKGAEESTPSRFFFPGRLEAPKHPLRLFNDEEVTVYGERSNLRNDLLQQQYYGQTPGPPLPGNDTD
jgi:hypothetical protein